MWKLKEPKVEGLLQKREILCEMNFSQNIFLIFPVLSALLKPVCALSILFFPQHFTMENWFCDPFSTLDWKTAKIKKKNTLSHKWFKLAWLKIFHSKFPIHGIILLSKWHSYVGFTNSALPREQISAFKSHFPNLIILGKWKIYSVKTFCSQQIWQRTH